MRLGALFPIFAAFNAGTLSPPVLLGPAPHRSTPRRAGKAYPRSSTREHERNKRKAMGYAA